MLISYAIANSSSCLLGFCITFCQSEIAFVFSIHFFPRQCSVFIHLFSFFPLPFYSVFLRVSLFFFFFETNAPTALLSCFLSDFCFIYLNFVEFWREICVPCTPLKQSNWYSFLRRTVSVHQRFGFLSMECFWFSSLFGLSLISIHFLISFLFCCWCCCYFVTFFLALFSIYVVFCFGC